MLTVTQDGTSTLDSGGVASSIHLSPSLIPVLHNLSYFNSVWHSGSDFSLETCFEPWTPCPTANKRAPHMIIFNSIKNPILENQKKDWKQTQAKKVERKHQFPAEKFKFLKQNATDINFPI